MASEQTKQTEPTVLEEGQTTDNTTSEVTSLPKLYMAIKNGETEAAINLINSGEDVNLRGLDGQTLLHLAVTVNAEPAVFSALLDKIEDFTLRDKKGDSVLELIYRADYHIEAEEALKTKLRKIVFDGDLEQIQRLVYSGWAYFPVTEEDAEKVSEEVGGFLEKLTEYRERIDRIHSGIKENDLEVVKLLQEDNKLCAACDRTGLPPLTKAVILGKNDLVREIAKFPESLNIKDHFGRVALHYAASSAGDELYQILTEAGAEDCQDKQGHTAADYKEKPDLLEIDNVREQVMTILNNSQQIGCGSKRKTPETEGQPEATQEGEGQPEATQEGEGQAEVKQEPEDPELGENPDQKPGAEGKNEQSNVNEEGSRDTNGTEPDPTGERLFRSEVYTNRAYREPTSFEGKYLASTLGSALTRALTEIAECRPWDPIEYLAHFLYKFHADTEYQQQQKDLQQQMEEEEEERKNALIRKQLQKEEQREILKEQKRKQREQEEEEERQRQELEEQQKKAKEAALAQPPDLATVKEETGESEVSIKQRDEHGQTELHKLAGQEGADLMAILNLGYSLADRDEEYRTPRDIAVEKGLDDNVEVMDNYIADMIEGERLGDLEKLLLDGYDNFHTVLNKVSTEGLPEDVTTFISAIPQFQTKIKDMIKAVRSGVVRDVRQTLDRKKFVLAKDNKGRSPLHNAVLYEHREVSEYIAQTYPISLKDRDTLNRTPLHYAAGLSDDLYDLLVQLGGDLTLKDVKGKTPSDYKQDKEEIIKLKEELPETETNGDEVDEKADDKGDDQEDVVDGADEEEKDEAADKDGDEETEET